MERTGHAPGSDRDDDGRLTALAEATAASLMRRAERLRTRAERDRLEQTGAFVRDPAARDLLFRLTDQVLRIGDVRTAGRRLADVVTGSDAPASLGALDRTQLWSAVLAARVTPVPAVARLRTRLRHALDPLVLDADPRTLERELGRMRAAGFGITVNPVGEAVLGDAEAQRRLAQAVELARRPGVDRISVKASGICANLDVLDHDGSVERLADAFGALCRAAQRPLTNCFVSLDQEEYPELWLTVRAFTHALDAPPLHRFGAGIALQAYLPESAAAFEELAAWALARVDRGGAPITVRLVKGAHLAMERVDAELHGWHPAPLATKAEVDANFKRLLDRILRPELAGAVRLGIGSHNLFDIGWALAVAQHRGVADGIDVEMLHGMADGEARAVAERVRSAGTGTLLMYTPVVAPGDDLTAATAYLLRRFDENVAPDNFLAHLPTMQIGTPRWRREVERFRASVTARREPEPLSRRTAPPPPGPTARTVPDTDWTQVPAREALAKALAGFGFPRTAGPEATGPTGATGATGPVVDVADPNTGLPGYRVAVADPAAVDRVLAAAHAAAGRWAATPDRDRAALLRAVAERVLADRFDTVAALAHAAGVPLRAGDREVSAVADLARHDARQGQRRDLPPGVRPHPVTVVTGRWDEPYAGPAAGVLAALAAGSTVVLAPPAGGTLVAGLLAEQCWTAGVPRDVLHLLPVPDPVGVAAHAGADAVVLSADAATVAQVRLHAPGRPVLARATAPGSVLVTATADLDDAVRGVVRSAFTGAVRSCGVVLVDAAVLEGSRFVERLVGAARSLRTGPATSTATQLGPVPPPTSEPGAGPWLLAPDGAGSPGVRVVDAAVAAQARDPRVLDLVRVEDLEDAIDVQNGLPGTCAGLFSLDDAETDRWLDAVTATDLVVNRALPGARAGRQATGGPGPKTGGPFQVRALATAGGTVPDLDELAVAVERLWRRWAPGEDRSGPAAEQDLYRVRPLQRGVLLRPGAGTPPEVLAVLTRIAGDIGVPLSVSTPRETTDGEFLQLAAGGTFDRVRLLEPDPAGLIGALLTAGADVELRPVGPDPVAELLAWTREQTVSRTRHRHGHLRAPA
jgi:RHH-type proline utilization regulon transcriptional repressor/proline dehydrogenase/delta 1-pyrroline-5-carboxylate dehydrogenase